MKKSQYIKELSPQIADMICTGNGFNVIRKDGTSVEFRKNRLYSSNSPYDVIIGGNVYSFDTKGKPFITGDEVNDTLYTPTEMRAFLSSVNFISEDFHVNNGKLNYKNDNKLLDIKTEDDEVESIKPSKQKQSLLSDLKRSVSLAKRERLGLNDE